MRSSSIPRCRTVVAAMLLALPAELAAQTGSTTPAPKADRAADSAAVIGVSEQLLKAISSRDTAAARTVLLPGAILVSVADPGSANTAPRVTTDASFYATLPDGKEKLLERMWSPTVVLHGPLAEVHTPYDFHIDGVFSHCGTDVFTLVRTRGTWRIAAVSYTTQRAGCAPSPLGPPK